MYCTREPLVSDSPGCTLCMRCGDAGIGTCLAADSLADHTCTLNSRTKQTSCRLRPVLNPLSHAPFLAPSPSLPCQPPHPKASLENPESSRDFHPAANLPPPPPPPPDELFLPGSPGTNTSPGSRRSRNSMRRQTFSSSSTEERGGFDSPYASPPPPQFRRGGGSKDVRFSSDADHPVHPAQATHGAAAAGGGGGGHAPRSPNSPPPPPSYDYGNLFNADSMEGRHRASPRVRREVGPERSVAEGGGARFAAGERNSTPWRPPGSPGRTTAAAVTTSPSRSPSPSPSPVRARPRPSSSSSRCAGLRGDEERER
ncbi:unnamed protein product, partial [Laminaria digitata]